MRSIGTIYAELLRLSRETLERDDISRADQYRLQRSYKQARDQLRKSVAEMKRILDVPRKL